MHISPIHLALVLPPPQEPAQTQKESSIRFYVSLSNTDVLLNTPRQVQSQPSRAFPEDD